MPSIGFIKLLLLLPVIVYAGLMAYAFLFANKLVFPAPPPGYSDSKDIIRFPYDDGKSVAMVFLDNPGSRHLIFYHHGNGEDLHSAIFRMQALREAGCAVLGWDYPGYGTSDGKPSEKLVNTVARKILAEIPSSFGYQPDRIIHYGRSLGGGPALAMAAEQPCAGIILEGTFTSIFRVGLGKNILPWDMFDNLARIRKVQCPVLVIHGTEDRVIPFSHGKALYEAAPGQKSFTWLDGGTHNNLIEAYRDSYYSSVTRFIKSI
ncbi:MAG: alpha/beta hydrolase [Puniceicoccaceae bacterium]